MQTHLEGGLLFPTSPPSTQTLHPQVLCKGRQCHSWGSVPALRHFVTTTLIHMFPPAAILISSVCAGILQILSPQSEKAVKIAFMKTAFHSFWKAMKWLCYLIEREQSHISELNCSKHECRAVSMCSSECRQAATVKMNTKFTILYNAKTSQEYAVLISPLSRRKAI